MILSISKAFVYFFTKWEQKQKTIIFSDSVFAALMDYQGIFDTTSSLEGQPSFVCKLYFSEWVGTLLCFRCI